MSSTLTLSYPTCTGMWRVVRREKVQRALFAVGIMAAWVLLGCGRTFPEIGCDPSDAKMRVLWQENRTELEKIVTTIGTAGKGKLEVKMVIDRVPKPDGSQEIERVRRVSTDRYSQLLYAASVLEISHSPHGYSLLVASCMHSTGYMYFPYGAVPQPLIDSIDNLQGVDAPFDIVYSHLEGGWYLYYDFHSVP